MASQVPPVPPHVEESIAAIAKLHAEHYRRAGAFQRLVSAATAMVARPRTLGLITLVIAAWVALNVTLIFSAVHPPDPFPFPLLSAAVSTVGLYLTAMILIAQRHDDELATRRDQLTLELAILSEQKSAKIIALLEEFRRNDPNQGDHRDELAEALAKPAETQVVLDAIDAAHGDPAAALVERPDAAKETDGDGGG
jgi:uncharacterized membrane protein